MNKKIVEREVAQFKKFAQIAVRDLERIMNAPLVFLGEFYATEQELQRSSFVAYAAFYYIDYLTQQRAAQPVRFYYYANLELCYMKEQDEWMRSRRVKIHASKYPPDTVRYLCGTKRHSELGGLMTLIAVLYDYETDRIHVERIASNARTIAFEHLDAAVKVINDANLDTVRDKFARWVQRTYSHIFPQGVECDLVINLEPPQRTPVAYYGAPSRSAAQNAYGHAAQPPYDFVASFSLRSVTARIQPTPLNARFTCIVSFPYTFFSDGAFTFKVNCDNALFGWTRVSDEKTVRSAQELHTSLLDTLRDMCKNHLEYVWQMLHNEANAYRDAHPPVNTLIAALFAHLAQASALWWEHTLNTLAPMEVRCTSTLSDFSAHTIPTLKGAINTILHKGLILTSAHCGNVYYHVLPNLRTMLTINEHTQQRVYRIIKLSVYLERDDASIRIIHWDYSGEAERAPIVRTGSDVDNIAARLVSEFTNAMAQHINITWQEGSKLNFWLQQYLWEQGVT